MVVAKPIPVSPPVTIAILFAKLYDMIEYGMNKLSETTPNLVRYEIEFKGLCQNL